jgi:hypothetical protein
MPTKIGGDGCRSQMAAEFAGKRALEEFSLLLKQEETRNARESKAP